MMRHAGMGVGGAVTHVPLVGEGGRMRSKALLAMVSLVVGIFVGMVFSGAPHVFVQSGRLDSECNCVP